MQAEYLHILRQIHGRLAFYREAGAMYLKTDRALAALMAVLLERQVAACRACRLCMQGRTPLFGQGPMDARLLIAGDMPLPEDVSQRHAFTGEPGNMLTRMLDAIGVSREDVFITTAVKCHAGTGDLPDRVCVNCCGRWLERQVRIIKPSLVLSLGPLAAGILLDMQGSSVEDFRGSVVESAGSSFRMVVTHSPAFMLKARGDRLARFKREAWHDLKLLETMYHG